MTKVVTNIKQPHRRTPSGLDNFSFTLSSPNVSEIVFEVSPVVPEWSYVGILKLQLKGPHFEDP